MKGAPGEKGAALIIALVVTAVMATVIVEIISVVHGQAGRTAAFIEGRKAAVAAEGAVELVERYLATLPGGYTYLDKSSFVMTVDGIVLEASVEDESGKIQVNSLVFPNGEVNGSAYSSVRSLFAASSIEPSATDALADWLDIDDTSRPGGAEAGYYTRLPGAYSPKNGHLYTLGELALIKGIGAKPVERLTKFLTVYTDGLVNINTAPKEVIMALSDEITPSMADGLIERRSEKPFSDTAGVRGVKGFETLGFGLQGRIKVKSDIFRVKTRAISGGVLREVEAVVRLGKPGKVLYWRAR